MAPHHQQEQTNGLPCRMMETHGTSHHAHSWTDSWRNLGLTSLPNVYSLNLLSFFPTKKASGTKKAPSHTKHGCENSRPSTYGQNPSIHPSRTANKHRANHTAPRPPRATQPRILAEKSPIKQPVMQVASSVFLSFLILVGQGSPKRV